MPLPKPRPSENRDEFVSRCMGDTTMNNDFPSNGQRFAVCLSQWERRDKESNDNDDTGN